MRNPTDQPNFEEKPAGERRAALLRYGITAFLALLCALGVANYRGLFAGGVSPADALKHASDGFFVSGALFFGFGALAWVSSSGFFDMLSYGFKSVWYLFTPATKPRGSGGFYEYKVMKAERRKEQGTVRHIAIVGLAELVIAALLTVVWYRV